MSEHWWNGDEHERYWLVVEYRDEGNAIYDPLATKYNVRAGRRVTLWHHDAVRWARRGDTVFHYDPFQKLVTHRSSVRRTAVDDRMSDGKASWRLPLDDLEALAVPLHVDDIRARARDVFAAIDGIAARSSGPVYHPFSRRDVLRFNQVYFAKLPAAVVQLFSQLDETYGEGSPGLPYTPAARRKESRAAAEIFERDPAQLERAVASHKRVEDRVAEAAGRAGWTAFRPRAEDPGYDLLLAREGVGVVVEVKSLTSDNEERQLRLGLGQVLRYRHQLKGAGLPGVKELHAALALERRPADRAWLALCSDLDIAVGWPGQLDVWRSATTQRAVRQTTPTPGD